MYKAVMMGINFASACSKGGCGRVHSVFDRAMNIEMIEHNNDVTLLTLLCEDSDIMPAALTVASTHVEPWREKCKIGGKVIFTPDTIYSDFVPLVGEISAATVWQPVGQVDVTDLPRLTYQEITARCKRVELYIQASGKDKSDFPVMSLNTFDATKLLGLGCGLTPSGDDFLAGMLFAMHFAQMVYARTCEPLSAIASSVLQNMTTKTNQISRHFLRYASEGLWGRATEQFMLALFGCDDNALIAAVRKKLSYGATSGMDEMLGIMFGLCETIQLFEGDSLCI